MYKNNLDGYKDVSTTVLDIEQLVSLGKKDKICPYFYSRDAATTADIVLLPYNYLMDSSIRVSLKIEWKNAIVIFDEAHNIERVAGDAASICMSSTDIAQCIAELKQVLQILQTCGETPEITTGAKKGDISSSERPKIPTTMHILKALFDFENRLDSAQLTFTAQSKTRSSTFAGSWLAITMESVGFSLAQVFILLSSSITLVASPKLFKSSSLSIKFFYFDR